MVSALLASGFHVLALGIGLGALFTRGLHFRGLKRQGSDKREELKSALFSDNFWGLAALLWIATGLLRLFGGLEKTPDFYFHNVFFFIKMGLFGLVFALEIWPMAVLIRLRLRLRRGEKAEIPVGKLSRLILLNDLELALVFLIPFAAAAMARGVWLIP